MVGSLFQYFVCNLILNLTIKCIIDSYIYVIGTIINNIYTFKIKMCFFSNLNTFSMYKWV